MTPQSSSPAPSRRPPGKHPRQSGQGPAGPGLIVKGNMDVGRVRDHNEDYFLTCDMVQPLLPPALLAQRGRLLIVADGMGGHAAGEVAARMTAEGVMRHYYQSQANPKVALREAILQANVEIYHAQQENSAQEGMGSTLVAALFLPNGRALVAHVGDSRLYRLQDGVLKQLTADHTWVDEKLRAHEITPQEAANHHYRGVITRAMGAALNVQPDIAEYDLSSGEVFLLCSDGLSNVVKDDELRQILSAEAPKSAVDRLIRLANDRGGPDNITAMVASYGRPADAATVVARLPRRLGMVGALAGMVIVAAVVGLALAGFLKLTPSSGVPAPAAPAAVVSSEGSEAEVLTTAPTSTWETGTAPEPASAEGQRVETTALPTPPTPVPPPPATKAAATSQPAPTAMPKAGATLPAPAQVSPIYGWSAPLDAVTFEWKPVPGAAQYRVETRSDREGQTAWQPWGPVDVPSLKLGYSDHADYFKIPGTIYYWRVVALDANGNKGSYSAERVFEFQRGSPKPPTETPQRAPTSTRAVTPLPAPSLVSPIYGWSAPLDAVTFEWKPVPGAAQYRVETRSDREGQTAWQPWGPVDVPSLKLGYSDHADYFKIPGTIYYWRVVALDANGNKGSYSAERVFEFQRVSPKPPTNTPKPPPTDTPKPPTNTPKPPTDTPKPPTDTPKPPPTDTPKPPPTDSPKP